jgi:hypothetical protein
MSKNKDEKKEKSALITSQIMAIDETIKELEKSYTSKKLLFEKQLADYNAQLIKLQEISQEQKPDKHIVDVTTDYAELKDTGNRSPSPLRLDLETDIQDTKTEIQDIEEKLKKENKDNAESLEKLHKQKSKKESELKEVIQTAGGRKTKRRRNLSSRERRTRRSRKTKMTRRK